MKKHHGNEIVESLKSLLKHHTAIPLAEHIAIATCDHTNLACVSDKELSFCLHRYIAELELDVMPHRSSPSYMDVIIKEGMDLDNIFNDEDEE